MFTESGLESEFREDYLDKSMLSVRIALALGVVLYSAFGVLDYLIAPLSMYHIWFIRFAIVVPALAAVFGLTYLRISRPFMQPLLSFSSLIAGFGIVAIIGVTVEKESSLYYYAGLILVIMWTYTFVRLRFLYATVCSWIIVLAYEFTAIGYQGLLDRPEMINIFVNNNFFFIASNVIGMFACYLIELYTRKDFLQRRQIASGREELQTERNNLQTRMDIMDRELEMARLIQQRFIPDLNPTEYISALYRPMEAVGGDLIDFVRFGEGEKIGLFMSDVSGHGVPAALITSMLKSSMLESSRLSFNPALVLAHLNRVLGDQTDENFVTAFYGVYDKSTRSIIYANAGHHPPRIILSKSVTTLDKAKRMPLAISTNEELVSTGMIYANARATIPAHSKLILYTDGLVEARNPSDRSTEFGESLDDRLLKLREFDCRGFLDALYGELVEFRGGDSFDDDICMICVDIR
ncbi:MAG: serine/threonine-protein phosphatase [Spirochaetes bacterium]|nr:MAG: serine/threonine-protein phosphatase [Spirochaetota bacterium]